MPQIPQYTAGYRTFVKKAIVDALRSVFDDFYDDPAFRDINIMYQYPFENPSFPMIIVRFNDRRVFNAGVGHIEILQDANGINRAFEHSRFEGDVEFTIYGLTAFDVDYAADALVEVLRFGSLEDQTNRFFETLYGEADLPAGQIIFNTDQIYPSGDQVVDNPWKGENDKLYSYTLEVELIGAFYSKNPSGELITIEEVDVYPTSVDQGFADPDPLVVKAKGSRFFDSDTIEGHASASAQES